MENWRKYLTEVVYGTSQFLKNDRHAYAILANLADQEVPLNIDQKNLKKLYRQIARQLHPDRNPNDANAAENLLQSGEAYNYILKKIENKPHDFRYFRDPSKNRGFGEIADKPPYKKETGTVQPGKHTPPQGSTTTGTTGRGEWTTAHTSNPYTTKKDRSKQDDRTKYEQNPQRDKFGQYRKLNKGESFVQYMESFGPEGKDILESMRKIYVILKEAQEKGKNAKLSRWFRANEYRVHVRGIYQGPDAREGFQIEKEDWENFDRFMKLSRWNMIRTTLEKNISLLQDRQQKGLMSRFMGIGAPLAAGAGRRFVNAGIFDYDLPAWKTRHGKGGVDGITSLTMIRDRDAVLAIMKYISRIWHYKRSQYGE
jgi:curved DNA-binding protein CbpA